MAEPTVAALGGRNGETLLRRVNAVHLRADGDHVEVRVFLEEESALQSGMDSQHFGFGLEEVDIGFSDHLQERRVGVGCPARVAVAVRHFIASERKGLLHRPFEMMLGRLDRGPLRSIDLYITLPHLDGGEVGGGLYKSGHVFRHGDHAVRALTERHDKAVGFVIGNEGFGHIGGLQVEAHIFLHLPEDTFHLGDEPVPLNTDLLFVRHGDGDDGFGFTGNSVAEVAAVDRGEVQFGLRPYAGKEPDDELVGVGTAFIDVIAGVTTH